MRYVRQKDSDTWHWCRNCANYPPPKTPIVLYEGPTPPGDGEQCNECQSKADNKLCRTTRKRGAQ